MRRFGYSLILGSLLLGVVIGQDFRGVCNSQLGCRECILANPSCVWCADLNYNGTRCYDSGDPLFAGVCAPAMEQSPAGTVGTPEGPALGDLIQVFPSTISVSVVPGTPQTFPLEVSPARNFPIDLYLLMDLSYSMRDDLDNLKRLGADLARSIIRLSSNFRIGFGSFVEKVVGPFTTLNPVFQLNPCNDEEDIVCEATYSYRHVISLTPDSSLFNASVQAQMISGNQDFPEGGFDGFLQSLLCTNLIGWRGVSRKLLLYITDAGFHFAGDGKLGGIILPHRSECRVTPDPSSSTADLPDAELYDYPSVGQIAQALREQDIIPIFAAQEDVSDFYDALAAELGDGAFVGTLESDSRNVVELVERLYNTISQRVIFDQAPVQGVSVSVTPRSCPLGFIENGICNGLPIEEVAEFTVSVSITECTPELVAGINVPVRVVGFGTLNILVTGVCECPCNMNTVMNSGFCSTNGDLTCGQCVCNQGNFGERCQCDVTNQQANLACPLGDNDVQCTGRGTCLCGECTCDEGFFGPACECVRQDCENENGEVCSNRGMCVGCNGLCMCELEPFSGRPYMGEEGGPNVCQCTPDNQNCVDPTNSTEPCNGRGTCRCDGMRCDCDEPEVYSGQFCEICSGPSEVCSTLNCDSNIECANCILDLIADTANMVELEDFFSQAMKNSSDIGLPPGYVWSRNLEDNNASEIITLPMSQCPQCTSGAVILSGTENTDYRIDDESTVSCPIDKDGCSYRYFVGVDRSREDFISSAEITFTSVHLTYNRTCTEPQFGTAPWIIAISILIPLLILGFLLLLLLKLLLLLVDYVEVQKFERDIKNTKYSKNENPLYRSAAKDYQNPLYGQ